MAHIIMPIFGQPAAAVEDDDNGNRRSCRAFREAQVSKLLWRLAVGKSLVRGRRWPPQDLPGI
jgi:hypothetical protein